MNAQRLLTLSCFLGLAGSTLVISSIAVARPIPVFLVLTAGQLVGAASLAFFVLAVLQEFPRREAPTRKDGVSP